MTCKNVREEAHKDPILSRIVKYLLCWWSHDVEPTFDLFVCRKLEMSIEQGYLVWGGRVVIPPNLREKTWKDLDMFKNMRQDFANNWTLVIVLGFDLYISFSLFEYVLIDGVVK